MCPANNALSVLAAAGQLPSPPQGIRCPLELFYYLGGPGGQQQEAPGSAAAGSCTSFLIKNAYPVG